MVIKRNSDIQPSTLLPEVEFHHNHSRDLAGKVAGEKGDSQKFRNEKILLGGI